MAILNGENSYETTSALVRVPPIAVDNVNARLLEVGHGQSGLPEFFRVNLKKRFNAD